ncbi:MAG: SelB C-terminal domain-containing protein, partial [Gemmatimonadales bacterium]
GVLRSYSPVTTIGGFVVIDPWPAPRPRRPTNLLAGPDRLRHAAAAAGPSGIPIADLPIRLRLPETAGQGTVQVGDRVVLTEHVTAARDGVIQALTKHHAAHPEAPGLGRDTLRDAVGPLTDHAASLLVTEKKIQDDGATLRMAGHAPALATHDTTAADALRAALDTAGFEGLDRTEVDVRLAEFLVREGVARRVGRDRYYLVTHLTAMLEIARQVLSKGEASPADFRDQLGISRKYLMPFLEWLDQEGYSVRSDGGRRAGHRLAAN